MREEWVMALNDQNLNEDLQVYKARDYSRSMKKKGNTTDAARPGIDYACFADGTPFYKKYSE